MSAELPNVTPIHANFHKQVGRIAGDLTDTLLDASRTQFGEVPDKRYAEFMRGYCASFLRFDSDALPDNSRPIPGSIAGSDALSFKTVDLPIEADEGRIDDVSYSQRFFPGRLFELNLHYGDYVAGYNLYIGPEVSPILLDAEACASVEGDLEVLQLSSAERLKELIPASKVHFPNVAELQILLHGLQRASNDMCLLELFRDIRDDADSASSHDNPDDQRVLAWTKPRLRYLEKVLNIGQMAERPFTESS